MENLTSLMRSLDDISSLIPEGTYLEMANNLKKVHETIPKDTDPPMLDLRSLPVNVPFQVVQPGYGYSPFYKMMKIVMTMKMKWFNVFQLP